MRRLPRSSVMLAGIGLAGVSALNACTRSADVPDSDAMARCYRAHQTATIALQVARPTMPRDENLAARRQLEDSTRRLLAAWAARESLAIDAAQFAERTGRAQAFLDGVNAEAGLSDQQRMAALSAASDAPELWREKTSTALDCADRFTS